MATQTVEQSVQVADFTTSESARSRDGETAPRHSGRWVRVIAGATASLFFLVVYLLRLDHVAGMVGDDALYILLARAMAEGQGFNLINSPIPGILPVYPPGFPLVLAIVFRFIPQFPDNLWLLKVVSIAAMYATGLVTYCYLKRYRNLSPQLALGVAITSVIMPAFVFLATSTVMAECVYTLCQLLTIVAIERCVEKGKEQGDWSGALTGAALAAFTFLVRSMGIGLVAAVFVYLVRKKLWRTAGMFTAGVILFTAPWLAYTRIHATKAEQIQLYGGSIAYGYSHHFWLRRAGDDNSGSVTWRDLPQRIRENTLDILGRDVGGIIVPALFRGAEESGQEVFAMGYNSGMQGGSMGMTTGTMWLSLLLSAVAIFGYILVVRQRMTLAEIVVPVSLLITVIWPWWPFRFVLPLAPWVIFYMLTGLSGIHQLSQRWLPVNSSPIPGLRVFLICVIALYGYDHVHYLLLKNQSASEKQPEWLREFEETRGLLQWMREKLPCDTVIASNGPTTAV